MMSAPSQDQFILGQRVALKEPEKGHHYAPRGTVRYVGPVDGHKGEWVGVEWDDPSRGKHDGVVTGKRYFQCEMVPAGTPAGSFVRPQKLTGGVTLRDALLDRYNTSGEDYKAEPIYRALGRRRAMVIELVSAPANRSGADKAGEGTDTAVPGTDREEFGGGRGSEEEGTQGDLMETDGGISGGRESREEDKGEPPKRNGMWLSRLQAANVSEVPVGSVGAAGEVAAIASLTELDMSYHLLNTWHEVQRVGEELRGLTALDIGHSRLAFPSPVGSSSSYAGSSKSTPPSALSVSPLAGLRKLGLSNTRVTWAQVEEISRQLPLLETLVLIKNGIAELRPIGGADVARAPVDCLQELVLSHKPYVPRLHSANQTPASTSAQANGNGTEAGEAANGSLTPGSGGAAAAAAAAAAADGEEGGRMERCEFGFGVTEEGRMGVIARIGSIQKLNCVQILPRERLDAEICYISHTIRSLPHATSLPQLVCAGHPALPALLAKHGLDLHFLGVFSVFFYASSFLFYSYTPSHQPSLGSFVPFLPGITFRVIAPKSGSTSTAKEVTKKLPQSTTASKMRPLIAQLLKLEPRSFSLFLLPSTLEGSQPLPSLLLDDTMPLGVLLHSTTTAALDASHATILVDTSLDVQQASSLSEPQVLACEERLGRVPFIN
ncbi:unnamed protein product [Closterium sp. Yama58-4]|nr:unnamed protein product [Closterium sp. Yama58-4]